MCGDEFRPTGAKVWQQEIECGAPGGDPEGGSLRMPNADTAERACGRSLNVPRLLRRRSTLGMATSGGFSRSWCRGRRSVSTPRSCRASKEMMRTLPTSHFATELQRLLLGERSVVINRAAISEATSDPTFAQILVAKGRNAIVPGAKVQRERLDFADIGNAAEVFIGLVMGDQQIRRLLGVMEMPGPRQIEARAERAVGDFLILFAQHRPK